MFRIFLLIIVSLNPAIAFADQPASETSMTRLTLFQLVAMLQQKVPSRAHDATDPNECCRALATCSIASERLDCSRSSGGRAKTSASGVQFRSEPLLAAIWILFRGGIVQGNGWTSVVLTHAATTHLEILNWREPLDPL